MCLPPLTPKTDKIAAALEALANLRREHRLASAARGR
jgi:hypothetical protein